MNKSLVRQRGDYHAHKKLKLMINQPELELRTTVMTTITCLVIERFYQQI